MKYTIKNKNINGTALELPAFYTELIRGGGSLQ